MTDGLLDLVIAMKSFLRGGVMHKLDLYAYTVQPIARRNQIVYPCGVKPAPRKGAAKPGPFVRITNVGFKIDRTVAALRRAPHIDLASAVSSRCPSELGGD
jgi:hypothetical protein